MNIKRIFITGFILLLPMMITIFVIHLAFRFINYNFAQPLGALILSILHLITGFSLLKEELPLLRGLIGFPLVLIIIIFIGYLSTLLGRRVFTAVEKYLLLKIPIVSLIYPYAKQLIDTFLDKEKRTEFKAVVALQYPRQGIYAVGFVTSDGLKDVKSASGKQLITVFIPSSPTPFTGYTMMVPKEEIINLNMTVDEAIRFVVSGGILTPDGERSKEVVPLGTPPSQ